MIDDGSSSRQRAPTAIVSDTMLRVANARAEIHQENSRYGSASTETHEDFHAVVLDYYYALRMLRSRNEIQEQWRTAKMFRPDRAVPIEGEPVDPDARGRVPVTTTGPAPHRHQGERSHPFDNVGGLKSDGWVYGVDNLAEWSNKTGPAERDAPGHGSATETVESVYLLSLTDLLRVAGLLDDLAESVGFSPNPEYAGDDPEGMVDVDVE